MPFWRREKPLHQRLAEAGGIVVPTEAGRDVAPWHQAGVHGVPRPREWDAVVTAEADVAGDAVHFVALDDGTLVVDEVVPDEALTPLAEAVEAELEPPYRAEATRRGERLWAVAASRIRVVRLRDEVAGDAVELAVGADGDRTLLVDGAPAFGTIPSLEELAAGMPAYVIRAERLDALAWEVRVMPL